ncbi:MAG TPA: hypothetical protein VIV60_19845, partial [Polyangiaceae bacterium]
MPRRTPHAATAPATVTVTHTATGATATEHCYHDEYRMPRGTGYRDRDAHRYRGYRDGTLL